MLYVISNSIFVVQIICVYIILYTYVLTVLQYMYACWPIYVFVTMWILVSHQ